jgi:hypothetical protein
MPRELKPLPPDDPIFHRGIIFVFKNALPSEQEEAAEDGGESLEFISPRIPERMQRRPVEENDS